MFYAATAKGGYKSTSPFDPDSSRLVGVMYRPPVWQANTVYYLRGESDYDIVIPTVFKGKYLKVINPGKSGATEPTIPAKVGTQFTDGDITWEVVAYNLMPPEETIVTSTWDATDSVIMSSSSHTDGTTQAMVETIPVGVTTFTCRNHIVKNNGEVDDVSIVFKIAPR